MRYSKSLDKEQFVRQFKDKDQVNELYSIFKPGMKVSLNHMYPDVDHLPKYVDALIVDEYENYFLVEVFRVNDVETVGRYNMTVQKSDLYCGDVQMKLYSANKIKKCG